VTIELVVFGTSLGGLSALKHILGRLPSVFPAIAIVQHRHRDSNQSLSDFLSQFTARPLQDVEDKDPILPGCIYLAPADYHLLVELGHFSLSTDDPVLFARPSIDVLFESAADVYGPTLVGVLLTGANQDGAKGLARIKACGGYTIVQDPHTAESPVMPEAAIAATPIDAVLPLSDIAPHLIQVCCHAELSFEPGLRPSLEERTAR
jgi:two-component system chemotaxis response regulator CheB